MADTKETKGAAFVPVPLQLLGKTTSGPAQVVENMQNPVLRRQANSVLEQVGEATGWAALTGGGALLLAPATVPAAAVGAVTGLGALSAGTYFGEGALDVANKDYTKGAAKMGLALADAATPSARQGIARPGAVVLEKGLKKFWPAYLAMEYGENVLEGRLRDETQAPQAPQEPYRWSGTSYESNPYRTARLPGEQPADAELVGAMPRNAR